MTVTRVIVVRVDRNPVVCRSRVAFLRRLNPGVAVYGLFGGDAGLKRLAWRRLAKPFVGFDHVYVSPHDGRWNWKNGDLALAGWYRSVGRHAEFDVLHYVEWDLLLADPLERLYAAVAHNAVGLTALTPLARIADDWPWLQRPEGREEWRRLLEYAGERGYDGMPYACSAVGPVLPRAFLARYADMDAPELCHDELRLPLFAQLLGFRLADTGFRRRWHDEVEDRIFNTTAGAIDPEVVRAELSDPAGRRAFHPFRESLRSVTR